MGLDENLGNLVPVENKDFIDNSALFDFHLFQNQQIIIFATKTDKKWPPSRPTVVEQSKSSNNLDCG